MKTFIDEELCIGCGLCVQVCPDVFEMKEDKAITKTETLNSEHESDCREAADNCPVTAIKIEQ